MSDTNTSAVDPATAPIPETTAAEGTKPASKPKATKAAKPADDTVVVFRSVARESYEFAVMDIPSELGLEGHLTWTVPAEDADRFERHWFVQNGRIIRT
jgi:hypothetical protein